MEEKNNGELVWIHDRKPVVLFLLYIMTSETYINRIISAKTFVLQMESSGENMTGRILNQAISVGTYETGH